MKLEFLGTGGYHPSEKRHTACVMLPETGVLFDAGTSFFRVPSRLETNEVQIFLTHAHLDHIIGLTYFILPILNKVVEKATVYGTRSTLDAVQNLLFSKPLFPVELEYQFEELTPQILVPQQGVLTHFPLKHPGGCVGYRIDWPDRSLAYVTDTSVDGSYTDYVKNVDLLIHECYFPDEMLEFAERTGHSYTSSVAKLARDAQVKKLYLVHVDPSKEEADPIDLNLARTYFPQTELATDLLQIEF